MELLSVLKKYNPKPLTSGQIKMTCPFREKHTQIGTPGGGEQSMFLSPSLNKYHCFSCKSKGLLSSLLVKFTKVSVWDTLKLLVEEERNPVKYEKPVIDWLISAPKDFMERGFTEEFLKAKKLGVKEGYNCIPIFNPKKELEGVQYRKVGRKDFYFSQGFNKRRHIYNLDFSRKDHAVITEGNFDCYRVETFGYNSGALMGCDFSIEQAVLLEPFEEIFIATDNDEPGVKAREVIYNTLLPFKKKIFIVLYDGEDPDKSYKRSFKKGVESRLTYMDYSLRMAGMYKEKYLKVKNSVLKELGLQ